MSWADNHRCSHGMTLNQQCDYCEIVGLKESLAWMKRAVSRDEKRLEHLLNKTNPATQDECTCSSPSGPDYCPVHAA